MSLATPGLVWPWQALHAVKRLAALPQFHGVLIQYAMEPLCTAIIPMSDVAAAKVGVRVLVKLAGESRNLKKMTTLEVCGWLCVRGRWGTGWGDCGPWERLSHLMGSCVCVAGGGGVYPAHPRPCFLW